MKKLLTLTTTLLLLLILTGCTGPTDAPSWEGGLAYSNEKLGFSTAFPEYWGEIESKLDIELHQPYIEVWLNSEEEPFTHIMLIYALPVEHTNNEAAHEKPFFQNYLGKNSHFSFYYDDMLMNYPEKDKDLELILNHFSSR